MIKQKPSFLLLFLLISFGSVCAVLFTPALPQISQFFGVNASSAQLTLTIFLIGYAVGQLIYGPLANAYGRKYALLIGIILEILSSILCIIAGFFHLFNLLVWARLFMALGSSVGLKMTFTLVADSYESQEGNRLISHLMMAFAITPGLGIALGGWLTEHFAWQSCFIALAIYGLFLFILALRMHETLNPSNRIKLSLHNIIHKYFLSLTHFRLICGGILMGAGTAFVYVFASLAPFVAMNIMHLNPAQYGTWNLLPPLGIIIGSQLAAHLSKKASPLLCIYLGLAIVLPSTAVMLFLFSLQHHFAITLFLPLTFIYIGISFIFGNASSIAMQSIQDKSSGSAMMNFINMGIATLSVLLTQEISSISIFILPFTFLALLILAILATLFLKNGQ